MNISLLEKYLSSQRYDDKLTERLVTQKEALSNFFKRQEIVAKCANDPIYFIENFCWVSEPRNLNNPEIEFFLFDYQKEVLEDIRKAETMGEDRLFEKSRDMGFTWMIACYYLWRILFTRGWIGLFGSRKQEEVDNKSINSFFGKVRYNLYKLPNFMSPNGFKKKLNDNENKITNPETNSLIQGESSNINFGRDRRSSICVLDELFLQEYAIDMWRNVAETSKCRIGISTPKPTRFAKTLKEAMTTNGWLRSYHWKQHPFKDSEWYEQEKKKYEGDEIGMRMELELEYSLDPQILVYPQAELIRIENREFQKNIPFYVSMDWGTAPSQTVFCWWQRQGMQWVLLEALVAKEKPFGWYVPFLNTKKDIDNNFIYNPREKEILDKVRSWNKAYAFYGEAAHSQKAITTATSLSQELAREGVMLKFNPLAIAHDKRQAGVKALIRQGITFNDTYFCRQVLDAMTMARFPKVTGTAEKVAPIHDETADARSAVENFAVNIINLTNKTKVLIYDHRFARA